MQKLLSHSFHRLISCFAIFLLTACQTNQAPQSVLAANPTIKIYYPEAFKPVETKIESSAEIFYLSPEVISEVRKKVLVEEHAEQQQLALLKFIFNDDKRKLLEYMNDATLTASETLRLRVANCLSLTILAAALAEATGFRAEFQDVDVPEFWVSRDGKSVLNGHVNLRISPRLLQQLSNGMKIQLETFLIDFDRANIGMQPRSKIISKSNVIAMFYNNKAADAILVNDFDLAYKYLQAALAESEQQAEIWNNLAVLYRKKEMLVAAEQIYHLSLQIEPDNNNTLSNLATLYERTGRQAQAYRLMQKIEARRSSNPYYFVMLGNEALEQGAYPQAALSFRQALKLQAGISEAHFGLAQVYYAQGNTEKARESMKSARKYAQDRLEQNRYNFKIGLLNAIAMQSD